MQHQTNPTRAAGLGPPGLAHGQFAVVTGGGPLHPGAASAVGPGVFVIAADSGLDHALGAGLAPGLLVGDLDSLSCDGLDWARQRSVPIDEHPCDKDRTDTELALATALTMGATDIVLLGGGGDRLDHTIGAISSLGHPALASCHSVVAHWGDSLIVIVHGPRLVTVPAAVDATVSLLALHGAAHGVSITGARWPLADAVIQPGAGLGISNVCTADPLLVGVGSGVLTVVVPGHFEAGGQQ